MLQYTATESFANNLSEYVDQLTRIRCDGVMLITLQWGGFTSVCCQLFFFSSPHATVFPLVDVAKRLSKRQCLRWRGRGKYLKIATQLLIVTTFRELIDLSCQFFTWQVNSSLEMNTTYKRQHACKHRLIFKTRYTFFWDLQLWLLVTLQPFDRNIQY